MEDFLMNNIPKFTGDETTGMIFDVDLEIDPEYHDDQNHMPLVITSFTNSLMYNV